MRLRTLWTLQTFDFTNFTNLMNFNAKIYIAGHRGLVGSAFVRRLEKDGYTNLITRTHFELDLLNQQAVADFFASEKPDYVFFAAARVGGIFANNNYPADFIYENLQMQNNVIYQSYIHGVKKLLFLGSSCIYPKLCPQPMKEEYLLTGLLEPTNEPYAIAKIAGIKMCQHYNRQYGTNFIAVMPTNLYGPNDNFHPENSHVFPALVRKFCEAKRNKEKKITIWGTGVARREFLHVDDMVDGSLFLMEHFNPTKEQNEKGNIFFNLGTGKDLTVKELVEHFKKAVDYEGKIEWDASKPDGMPQKLQDVTRIHDLGWRHSIELDEGIKMTCGWYLENL